MDKGTKKKADSRQYDGDAIDAIIAKYGFTSYYIRQCINGNRSGIVPDNIKKEYTSICREIASAKQKVVQKFTQI